MSSTGLRSLAGTEVGVDVTIGETLGQDPGGRIAFAPIAGPRRRHDGVLAFLCLR
jgi:hypothetical protein